MPCSHGVPSRNRVTLTLLLIVGIGLPGNVVQGEEPTPEQIQFFETHVRPVFVEHCYECHSVQAKKLQAELHVDSRAALFRGGESGASLNLDDPDSSLILESIRYESYEMPPRGKLPEATIQRIAQWVEMGAPWPSEPEPVAGEAKATEFNLSDRRESHWAWQKIANPTPPEVHDTTWVRNEIDRYVLSELEAVKLKPAPRADVLARVRRLCFDLVGLPPTAQQLQPFLDSTSNEKHETAFVALLDELLSSPHFGEQWGRHWLDLVRYAESRGHEFDDDTRNAFQYRDYVIRAFNLDLPYDQFVREHIAGDLLKNARLNPEHGFNESILGTGFWFLGEWVHSPVDIRKDESDRFDNMIDVMSKTFLGMTVACARCHDHKFDAISAADYYALSGFLQSSDFDEVRFESLEHNRDIATRLAVVDQAFRDDATAILDKWNDTTWNELSANAASIPAVDADQVAVDYSAVGSDELMQSGFLFGDRPRKVGEITLSHDDGKPSLSIVQLSAAASDPFWNGLVAQSESGMRTRNRLFQIPRAGRTLRTPTFALTAPELVCVVRGRGQIVACVDSHRFIAGPLHGETLARFETKNEVSQITLHLGRYVGHRLHLEFTPDEGATAEVCAVVQGANPKRLREIRDRHEHELRLAEKLKNTLEPFLESPDALAAELRNLATRWSEARHALNAEVQRTSKLAMAMKDGTGEDDHLLIRGNSATPGDPVPRRFLSAIDGNDALAIQAGSGRLQLADRINSDDNPLSNRVIVNRVWHHLMGRGIVPTTDDFGVLGQRPTHPKLLDHLATRFVEEGKSIKQMIRYIAMSNTYQMSSHVDAVAQHQDPTNRLWHHRPPQRLQAEAIRDSLLVVSGQWDPAMYGEPVPIHLTNFMQGRGRPERNGPLDGANRRSVYTAVRRNFLSPFMLAFDAPVPFSSMGRRNVSNVPAQALILMNDPLVVQQATKWAERAIETVPNDSPDCVSRRIQWMIKSAFARPANDQELRVATEFLSIPADDHSKVDDVSRWADFAHVLVNTKEFIFLR